MGEGASRGDGALPDDGVPATTSLGVDAATAAGEGAPITGPPDFRIAP